MRYRCEESLYFRRAEDIKGLPAAVEESTVESAVTRRFRR